MRVSRNFAMNCLEPRLHQGIHEPGKNAFAGCRCCTLSSAGAGNAANIISDSNHDMSPSQIKASANVPISLPPVAPQYSFSCLRQPFATMHRCPLNRAYADQSLFEIGHIIET